MFYYYLRLAFKSLRQTPAISCLMLLAIAIGIGISMTTLVLHHMRSADPLPNKSDKLAVIQLQVQGPNHSFNSVDNMHGQLTYQDATQLIKSGIPKGSTALFTAGFKVEMLNVQQAPANRGVLLTTADFFSMFDVPILYGNVWDAQADEYAESKVVIGKNLNQSLFAGKNSVGEKLIIQRKVFEIVAVLDQWQPIPKFYEITTGAFNQSHQLYIPLSHSRNTELDVWNNFWGSSEAWITENIETYEQYLMSEVLWLHAWVEFSDAKEKQDFANYIQAYIHQQQQLGRFKLKDAIFGLKDLTTWLDYKNVIGKDNYILLVLSFLFLAVCLVNTLGLMLSKFLRRAPDVGVRRALGASRKQIFMQYLVEVGVLGFFGGLVGLLFTHLALGQLRMYSGEFKVLAQLDWQMLLSAPLLAISVTIIAGLYPAWRICQTQPSRYLKSQ